MSTPGPGWSHGASGYKNYGCRCRTCKDGWAADHAAYILRRRARTGERIVNGYFVPAAGASGK